MKACTPEAQAATLVTTGPRSPFWMHLLATVLDRPVTLYAGAANGPAFGAARLARLAVTHEAPEAVCGKPDVLKGVTPRPFQCDPPKGRYTWRQVLPR